MTLYIPGVTVVLSVSANKFSRSAHQRWSRGHKARCQGQEHKKISRPRTDPLEAKDTGASVLQKKEGFQKNFSSKLKKKVFKKFFSGDFHLRKTKKGLRKFSARFLALSNKISTV